MISSLGNAKVKEILALQTKSKERKNKGVFIVEGIRMIKEVPDKELLSVFISERFNSLDSAKEILSKISKDKIEVLSDKVFNAISDTVTPQGILGIVKQNNGKFKNILEEIEYNKAGCYLVLENIQDPGNMGTIIRTAEGAGVGGIVISKDSVDLYSPKVVRSTMGAIFRMNIAVIEDMETGVALMKKHGCKMFAAHLKGEKYYYEADFSKKTGIMIGNEGNGLTDKMSALADEYIKIPMEGNVESLNASMAAGILMYDAKRQRDYIK